MKELQFKVIIDDEDYEAWKKGDLFLRVYYRDDRDVKFVTVPKDQQDLLDMEIINDIQLAKMAERAE